MAKKKRSFARYATLDQLPDFLGADRAECWRWASDGRIPPLLVPYGAPPQAKAGGKKKRQRTTALFDKGTVSAFRRRVSDWREADAVESEAGRFFESDAATAAADALASGVFVRTGIPAEAAAGAGREGIALRIQVALRPEIVRAYFPLVVGVVRVPTEDLLREAEAANWSPESVEAAGPAIDAEVRRLVDDCRSSLEAAARSWAETVPAFCVERDLDPSLVPDALGAKGRLHLVLPMSASDRSGDARALAGLLDETLPSAVEAHAEEIGREHFGRTVGYDRYPALFPLARSIGRRIVFMAGPTNSGKTHEAMRLAIEAERAEILSPLRLLAMEHRDILLEAGLDAGFVTGEERDLEPRHTHVARTIETLDLGRRVPVAVIDEIQMLGDRSRGWAWTQALVGVPADLVVLTGSPDAIPLVQSVVATLGEELEIRTFARKTPLRVENRPAGLRDLRRGDAVVAFSRRDVHYLRDLVVSRGLSVATVYGALGPEVRRAEAARFRSGAADVIVATDAIGMGLNLPVERVVFAKGEKYDGEGMRPLEHSEILQISGRAGRFGKFEEGRVTVLDGSGAEAALRRIAGMVGRQGPALPNRAFVRPNMASIEAAAELLQTDRLAPILRYLEQTLVRRHPDLKMADMDEDIMKAGRFDRIDLPLRDRYVYSIAPVSLRSSRALDRVAEWARSHAAGRRVASPLAAGAGDGLESLETQAHVATVWLWLSQRFPENYRDVEDVRAELSRVNGLIEEQLARTSQARVRAVRSSAGA